MNDHPIHHDDINALRREGDLSGYMRSLIRPTRQAPNTQPPPPRTGRAPGTWPPGTHPPGPPSDWDHPPEAWADAVRRYRTETRRTLNEEEP